MNKYKFEPVHTRAGFRWAIYNAVSDLYFAGYDIKGNAQWSWLIKDIGLCLDWAKASQIVKNLDKELIDQ